MDTLPSDLEECAFKSTNNILANALKNDGMRNVVEAKQQRRASTKRPAQKSKKPSAQKRGSIAADTVWTKFRGQLTNLMTSLETTRTRYIRCIKPNQKKLPLEMEHLSTIEQLRCAGVVAAVTISRSAFPNRLEHEVVLERFKSLWGKGVYPSEEIIAEHEFDEQPKFLVELLLSHALQKLEFEKNGNISRAFVIGKSRAYFRAGSLEYMEAERLKYLSVWAKVIQRVARGFTQKSKYKKIKKGAIYLEAQVRMKIGQRNYRHFKAASIQTQCWLRCILAARLLIVKRRNYRAAMIQTHWRMAVATSYLKTHRKAAIAIQAMSRGALQRPKFRAALHEKREEAKLENQLRALQRKLEEAEQRRVEAEKMAEEKALKAVQEYRESTIMEEKKVETTAASASADAPNAGEGVPSSAESVASAASASPSKTGSIPSQMAPSVSATVVQLSAQQQNLMDESGKMLEYLRKEVFKLRNQNTRILTDFELVKENNRRLMDANASAGASFTALNQHAKQLTKTNTKLSTDCTHYRQTIQRMNVTQVELKEELKMKQATYIAEVRSRLNYQRALGMIVELVSERCRDTRLVEDILRIADEAEAEEYGGAASSAGSPSPRHLSTPGKQPSNDDSMLSRFKSYWS
jgi:myosin heavy subunit